MSGEARMNGKLLRCRVEPVPYAAGDLSELRRACNRALVRMGLWQPMRTSRDANRWHRRGSAKGATR